MILSPNQKIDKIYDAIVGDEFNKGLIKEVEENKNDISKLKGFNLKLIGIGVGAMSIWGFLTWLLTTLV